MRLQIRVDVKVTEQASKVEFLYAFPYAKHCITVQKSEKGEEGRGGGGPSVVTAQVYAQTKFLKIS